MSIMTVNPKSAALVLIDVQPAFVEWMSGSPEPVLTRIEHLLLLAEHFHLPCLATFEHPVERKGWLPVALERVVPATGQRFVKRTYGCCNEPEIRDALQALNVKQLIVGGAETDVCVLQSVLGMLELGFQVFLLEDCVFTSESEPGPALRRMYQAGVIPLTYKTLHYELTHSVDVPQPHVAWNARLGGEAPRYKTPEALAPWESALHSSSALRP
ncbi:MAG TPA: isochorismatase family protein [Thermomicrobiaceae bacterium]|nr:isochorismatase family protein [Thermomicrobiaceae bacterium]